ANPATTATSAALILVRVVMVFSFVRLVRFLDQSSFRPARVVRPECPHDTAVATGWRGFLMRLHLNTREPSPACLSRSATCIEGASGARALAHVNQGDGWAMTASAVGVLTVTIAGWRLDGSLALARGRPTRGHAARVCDDVTDRGVS